MDLDQSLSFIRFLLKYGAGYLLAKGIADASQVEQITSGILAVVSVIWAFKHQTEMKNKP